MYIDGHTDIQKYVKSHGVTQLLPINLEEPIFGVDPLDMTLLKKLAKIFIEICRSNSELHTLIFFGPSVKKMGNLPSVLTISDQLRSEPSLK
jgi:hypothetical protein